ncbi:hypothetical protein [Aestuariispira insulae]|uniref:Uncharacterized protein n=1 Tax=Aestuariispira insulae TaxID=1461337 RepID=A0A3D9HS16_9PROT|nr:hypothetical protein [Aestuariispira insulae]RED52205.1 hypothetical protein DFP90_102223 [Aestuariispira insulae]
MQLAPFQAWSGVPTTDSRRALARNLMDTGKAATEEILKGFEEILAVEGPMLSNRLFSLYSKQGGLSKLTPQAKKRFSQALKEGGLNGRFGFEQDPGHDGVVILLWLPKAEKVSPRELGNRSIMDVPLNELTEVMFEVSTEINSETEKQLINAMAALYKINRLSADAESRLQRAYDQLFS